MPKIINTLKLDNFSCPVCKNKMLKEIFDFDSYSVVRCLDCKLEFNLDFPPRGTKENSFSEEYYRDVQKEAFAMQEKNYLLDPSLVIYKSGLNKIENFTSGRRLLDVGAGLGAFMKLASDFGWKVEGVEISPFASEFIRKRYGFKISSKDLLSAAYTESSFDAITFWDVIEHVETPKESLKKAYDLLKPEGILLVATDNYNSLLSFLARALYFFGPGIFRYHAGRVFLPYNKIYLNKDYAYKLIEKIGFQVVFLRKIQYPLSKLKLSKIERAIVYLLYKLESILGLQSQFLIIAKKDKE